MRYVCLAYFRSEATTVPLESADLSAAPASCFLCKMAVVILTYPFPSSQSLRTVRMAGWSTSNKDGRCRLEVIGRPRFSSILHDMAWRGRPAFSTHTTFTTPGRTHVHAPIQMHDVITSTKSKNVNYQTIRRHYITADGPA